VPCARAGDLNPAVTVGQNDLYRCRAVRLCLDAITLKGAIGPWRVCDDFQTIGVPVATMGASCKDREANNENGSAPTGKPEIIFGRIVRGVT